MDSRGKMWAWKSTGKRAKHKWATNTNPFSLISVSLQILFPGLWEVTLVDYYDTKGKLCNFVVSCTPPASVDEVIKLFESNFQKHYTTNRAPFLIPLEPKWLQNNMSFKVSSTCMCGLPCSWLVAWLIPMLAKIVSKFLHFFTWNEMTIILNWWPYRF